MTSTPAELDREARAFARASQSRRDNFLIPRSSGVEAESFFINQPHATASGLVLEPNPEATTRVLTEHGPELQWISGEPERYDATELVPVLKNVFAVNAEGTCFIKPVTERLIHIPSVSYEGPESTGADFVVSDTIQVWSRTDDTSSFGGTNYLETRPLSVVETSRAYAEDHVYERFDHDAPYLDDDSRTTVRNPDGTFTFGSYEYVPHIATEVHEPRKSGSNPEAPAISEHAVPIRDRYTPGNFQEELVQKYHERLLNIFRDNNKESKYNGHLRVGSVVFGRIRHEDTTCDDNLLVASCTRYGCERNKPFRMETIEPGPYALRYLQEAYTREVIRHSDCYGNTDRLVDPSAQSESLDLMLPDAADYGSLVNV